MSEKHEFFQKQVARLAHTYKQIEAEELVYRLIDAYLNKTRLQFWDITGKSEDLTDGGIVEQFDKAINRLLLKEPVQYIIGHTYFLDYKIEVNPSVLIPRQETEELVLKIIELEQANQNLRILDIGTGSGCIPIALSDQLSTDTVVGLDVSEQSLKVAQRNIKLNNVNVELVNANILSDEIELDSFDVIVSNPPYVLESDKQMMDENVLNHEPELALFVSNDDPLLFYKAIAEKGKRLLKKSGRLYLEIHENYGQEVSELLEKAGYSGIKIQQDTFLSKDRMVFSQIG